MNIKAHVPNTITLLNLFCGCIAIVFAFNHNFEFAFLFVCLGIFLDFFDGFFARLFKVSSPLGLQLDSLADMVTSGVAPGTVMFFMMAAGMNVDSSQFVLSNGDFLFCLLGFIITMGSCYRLANFNIDTRQTDSFIGLPTPANALFILSLPLVKANTDSLILMELLLNKWVLLGVTLLSAYILNAEIPLFSLKVKNFSVKGNMLQIVFLAISVLLLVFFQYLGIPMLILTYVLISAIYNKLQKK